MITVKSYHTCQFYLACKVSPPDNDIFQHVQNSPLLFTTLGAWGRQGADSTVCATRSQPKLATSGALGVATFPVNIRSFRTCKQGLCWCLRQHLVNQHHDHCAADIQGLTWLEAIVYDDVITVKMPRLPPNNALDHMHPRRMSTQIPHSSQSIPVRTSILSWSTICTLSERFESA